MSNPRITIKNLKDARTLLRENGWCEGQLKQEARHCLIGAIGEVKGADLEFEDDVYDLIDAAENSVGGRALRHAMEQEQAWLGGFRLSGNCWRFNDGGRSCDGLHVLDLLTDAIGLAESGAV